jgi:hypothetical protein
MSMLHTVTPAPHQDAESAQAPTKIKRISRDSEVSRVRRVSSFSRLSRVRRISRVSRVSRITTGGTTGATICLKPGPPHAANEFLHCGVGSLSRCNASSCAKPAI